MPTGVLFELTKQCIALHPRVLVNDRFDVALAAGAAGVHVTSQSISTSEVRRICGDEFIIGVSTHSLDEVLVARDEGADFVVFGPVFDTASKRSYGPAQGLAALAKVCEVGLPVIALGGVALENVEACFRAGASGVAGIGMFSDLEKLEDTVAEVRRAHD